MNHQIAPIVPVQISVITLTADEYRNHLREAALHGAREALREAQGEAPAKGKATYPERVTRRQAAAILDVSLTTIDVYCREGLLAKMKVGTHSVRLNRDEVENLARTI